MKAHGTILFHIKLCSYAVLHHGITESRGEAELHRVAVLPTVLGFLLNPSLAGTAHCSSVTVHTRCMVLLGERERRGREREA